MRTFLPRVVQFICVLCIVLLVAPNTESRDRDRKTQPTTRESTAPRLGTLTKAPSSVGLSSSAGVASADTFLVADFSFDDGVGGPDAQGWVSADLTDQDTFFHVDNFAGLVNYAALAGNQSMWCGVRPNDAPCFFKSPPGYGNNWDQRFESATFATQGNVTISFLVEYDSESTYDITHLQYRSKSNIWQTLASYDGVGQSLESHTVSADSVDGLTKFRFRFVSDQGFSDQDSMYVSNGAVVLDSITVSDVTGVVDFQDFELEGVNDLATLDGDWAASILEPLGDYAALFDGATVLQQDPAVTNNTHLWGFFNGSPDTYACGGFPQQPAVPFMNTQTGVALRNEVRSPVIDISQDLGGTPLPLASRLVLAFDVYQDLPLDNLMFYQVSVRSEIDGCLGEWNDDPFVLFGSGKTWVRETIDVFDLVDPGATNIQVALRAVDLCPVWCDVFGSGACHSHAPLFDNVQIMRAVRDTIVVTSPANDGPGSLRQAMVEANAAPDANVICFNIPGAGQHTIALTASLPVVTHPVLIDGRTQPGYALDPLVIVDGTQASATPGLVFEAGDGGVFALEIQNFPSGGIIVGNNAQGVQIRQCEIRSNIGPVTGLGIDLGNDGVTANDPSDSDTGANNLQNFPIITLPNPATSTIDGTISSTPNTAFDIDLFTSSSCGVSGHGGAVYLGSTVTTTDASGNGSFSASVASFLAHQEIGVTATDPAGNTSEFAACVPAAPVFVVTNTNDSGPGSLTQAILDTNSNPGQDRIVFNIPGPGPHVIMSLLGFPALLESVIVDGYTQPGASANTNGPDSGTNAVVMIEIDGQLSLASFGLEFVGDVVLRGMAIHSFSGSAILMSGDFSVVEGCFIGTDATGMMRKPNLNGVTVIGSNCVIGGSTSRARNLISGNDVSGIETGGTTKSGTVIAGNLIGTDATGTGILENFWGLELGGQDDITLGGPTAEERNVISGNTSHGITTKNVTMDNLQIVGNYIGVDVTGVGALGNGGDGFDGFDMATTPSTMSFDQNVVANNTGAGFLMTLNTFLFNLLADYTLSENSIFDNGGLGIDVLNPGVSTGLGAFIPKVPVISAVTTNATSTTIDVFVEDFFAPGGRIEFYASSACDATGYGEGGRFLGSHSVTTEGNYVCTVPAPAYPGGIVTATITGGGRTSEFSLCVAAVNTSAGTNVVVQPVDETTSTTPATLTFDNVSGDGITTLVTSGSGPVAPPGFNIDDTFFDLTTTATFTGNVEVCINYDSSNLPGHESTLRLFHHDGFSWVDVTTNLDTNADMICGQTTTLSPFVLATPVPTGIGDQPVVPARLALYQNWPNPFNPTTTISYDVPVSAAHVTVTIYDVSGRRVRVLVDGRETPGRKTITWDGRNQQSQPVATGVYFYRMSAGKFSVTKKMIMLK